MPCCKSRNSKCFVCTNQGPSVQNPCSCFYKTIKQAAKIVATISCMMNIVPIIYYLFSLSFNRFYLTTVEVTGVAVFIIFCAILIATSALLKHGVNRNSVRFCFPWVLCQTFMIILIVCLIVINGIHYSNAVSRKRTITRNTTSSPKAVGNTSLPKNEKTTTSTVAPVDIILDPSTPSYLAILIYFIYHLVVSLWLELILIVYLRTVTSLVQVESEISNSSSVPDILLNAPSTQAGKSTKIRITPSPAVDPDKYLKRHSFEIEDEDENENEKSMKK